MHKSCSLILICALFSCILAGCWDRSELNDLGITSATGIDWSEGRWIISYQVVVPSGMWSGTGGNGSSSQATIHVFSSEGKTIREAASNSNLEIPRQLYFAHTDLVVIGKAAAEHGLADLVETYLRSVEARESVVMAVTEQRASDILKLFVPLERIPGDAINKIMSKQEAISGYFSIVRLIDFARDLYSDSRTTGVPEVNLRGKRDAEAHSELTSQDFFKMTFSDSRLRLTGVSVFKDARRIGRLDLKESFGVSILSAEVKKSIVAVPCPSASSPNGFSSFRVEKNKDESDP
ncbi:Ger(x)C family spore germination protein [Cohnella sp.]|uniref:Ger(x)C family spore germination protein n=1 Tax=Cohnella sp. TaxID=1883426 RepID=UPI0035625716